MPSDSYQGLLLPYNPYDLLNANDSYIFTKNILLKDSTIHNISTSLIGLPHNINIGSFTYNYNSDMNNYYLKSNIMAVDYGEFIDSESMHTFSSNDFIISNTASIKIKDFLYSSLSIKYINSNIEQYNSDALAVDFNLYYYNNNFIFTSFINNYGFITNSYTDYSEQLPQSYGFNLIYRPVYLNSIFSIQYQLFHDYNELNIFSELFIFNNSSISLGYTTLANDLNYGDFTFDFFTGMSFGFSTIYKEYTLNIGVKNLGSVGVISSIGISKSINQF